MPPVKFGKTSKQYDRMTKKSAMVYDYMKCKSNADLIEAYNKDGIKPKLRQKIRIELDRRVKIGKAKIVFASRYDLEYLDD
jgi:hypothetical protein